MKAPVSSRTEQMSGCNCIMNWRGSDFLSFYESIWLHLLTLAYPSLSSRHQSKRVLTTWGGSTAAYWTRARTTAFVLVLADQVQDWLSEMRR